MEDKNPSSPRFKDNYQELGVDAATGYPDLLNFARIGLATIRLLLSSSPCKGSMVFSVV